MIINNMAKHSTESNNIVLSYYDCLLHEADINLLTGPRWLNDVIIGFYFEYLSMEVNKPNQKDLLFISPELTQLLKMSDPSQYDILLGPLGTANYKFVFFPLNNCESKDSAGGSHWSLIVFSKPERTLFHFDSLRGYNSYIATEFAKNIMMYLLQEEDQRRFVEVDSPQQDNGSDCGLFVLCLTDVISEYALQTSKVGGCDLNCVKDLVRNKRQKVLNLIDTLKCKSESRK